MRLIIRDDKTSVSKYIANYIVYRIKTYGPAPEKPFVLGLPTGSSPEGVYKHLVQAYKKGEISFKDVVTFNMDEYVGIPREHLESYHTFMYKNFFSHIDIPPSQINILNGNAADLEAECIAYEEKILRAGGIELFLGGIGPDGHIAFNEPGSSLSSRTRVKTLAYDTILANSRFFGGDVEKVPKMALTVGIQTILDAREVLVVATGPHKAMALQKCIEGGVNHMWTLSALQLHQHAMVIVDEDATLELQVKTVKYFKSIESVASLQGFSQSLPSKEQTARKRDSVLEKLDSPRTPTAKEYIADSKAGSKKEMTAKTASLELPKPELTRSLTPDLVPEPMHDRLPSEEEQQQLLEEGKEEETSLSPPNPDHLTRAVTPELIPEPMHDRLLESEVQPGRQTDSLDDETGSASLSVPKPELERSISTELVPEPMHDRLPEKPAPMGLDGLEGKELPLESMSKRIE